MRKRVLSLPVEPNDLAAQLGVTGKALRSWLRRTYPRSPVDHNARWSLAPAQVAAARARFAGTPSGVPCPSPGAGGTPSTGRRESRDEEYVVDLCDDILGETARRQHTFDWLLGDPGKSGVRARLPVDAYYPVHEIVVEYRERQHDEPVAFFDKPARLTVSGVHRGEQRRLYDPRRDEFIPAQGLRLVVIRPGDLAADSGGRLRQDRAGDLPGLRAILGPR